MRAAAALALLALAAAPARAYTIYDDPLEGDEVTLGAAVKSFAFGMHGGALDMRPFGPDADPSGLALLSLRPTFEAQLGDVFRVALHYDMATTVSSVDSGAAASAVALGRGLPPPRFLPLTARPVDEGTFAWRHTLDWAFVRVRMGPVDATVGRQPVTLGRAFLWKTLDLLATFAPTEIDTEWKPGVDALRLDVALGGTGTLTLVAVAGERDEDDDAEATLAGSAFAARATFGGERFDLGAFAGYVRRDAVFGLDAFVDLEVVSLHAEVAATWVPDADRAARDGDAFVRATLGVVWTIPKLRLVAEAHYSGVGGAAAGDYLDAATSPRAAIGEVYTLGRFYLGALVRYEPHPLVGLSLTTMANLRDPSALLGPSIDYSLAADARVVTGAFLPVGRGLDKTPLPEAGSEFGLYPFVYFLELRVAL